MCSLISLVYSDAADIYFYIACVLAITGAAVVVIACLVFCSSLLFSSFLRRERVLFVNFHSSPLVCLA